MKAKHFQCYDKRSRETKRLLNYSYCCYFFRCIRAVASLSLLFLPSYCGVCAYTYSPSLAPLSRQVKGAKAFHSSVSLAASVPFNQYEADDANPVDSMEALDALVPRKKIKELTKAKSNLQGILQVLWHASIFLLAACIPNVPISIIAMAFVSSFFFHGLHETVHRTAFRSPALNHMCAQIFGFLCFRPAQHYRYYHWQHHKYTGNPELDSELQSSSFLDLPVETVGSYLFYLSGIPFWIDAVSSLFRHAASSCPEMYLKNKSTACRQVITEARIYVALYTFLFSAALANASIGRALSRFWILPTLLGQPFLRFYLLAEHRGRKTSPFIYENTRTMTGTNALYRKLAWFMPYHAEHHAWPSVPFHKLPEAHTLLKAGGQEILDSGEVDADMICQKGYIAFNWVFLQNLWTRKNV